MPIAKILQTLVAHDVDFIVVGGMAAVLQGAPVRTLDVDVVYALDADNVSRMLGALQELDARFRDDPRGLHPDRQQKAPLAPPVMEEIPGGGHGPQWKKSNLLQLSWIDRSLWV